jgi:hypothetical protein
MYKIEITIIIDDLSFDTPFRTDLITMLEETASESKNRMNYQIINAEIIDPKIKMKIKIYSDVNYIGEIFKKKYESLLVSYDKATKCYLVRDILFYWKLINGSEVLPRKGKWDDLESYVNVKILSSTTN